MRFSIIPDYNELDKSVSLANEYDAAFEYNDFAYPEVYDHSLRVVKRITAYKNLRRDRSADTMHGTFLGLDIAALDPVLRDRSRQLCMDSIVMADKLGVKGIVFHTGLIGGLRLDYYLEHWLEEAVSFWSEICAAYPNLTVYMENSFEQEPDIFVRLMEKMSGVSNFKLCLDYGHAILTGTPIEIWVKTLAPYIGHMHLNDNDLKDDYHLVPGTGKIDYKFWKKLMKENGIDCSVLLEISGLEKAQAALEFITEVMRED